MTAVYVCPKSQVASVAARLRPSHLITLLDPTDEMPTPEGLARERHLRIGIHDVTDHDPDFQYVVPQETHVREIIAFARQWDTSQPLLVHCWAGISRSTATAFTALCMINKPGAERDIAMTIRKQAPHAQPNMLLVAHADRLLGRDGRMVDALDAMGPAKSVYEGHLFELPLKY